MDGSLMTWNFVERCSLPRIYQKKEYMDGSLSEFCGMPFIAAHLSLLLGVFVETRLGNLYTIFHCLVILFFHLYKSLFSQKPYICKSLSSQKSYICIDFSGEKQTFHGHGGSKPRPAASSVSPLITPFITHLNLYKIFFFSPYYLHPILK